MKTVRSKHTARFRDSVVSTWSGSNLLKLLHALNKAFHNVVSYSRQKNRSIYYDHESNGILCK